VRLEDGCTARAHDTANGNTADSFTVFWHHGSPQTGAPLAPLLEAAAALGIARFAVMGASGGGPHALACAALLPDRVTGVACLASLAPFDADGIDWFDGMASDGASLRAAVVGREARELYEATAEFDPESFVDTDYAPLAGNWTSLGEDVGRASEAGTE
jgi:pimeloyl-ACP methyl ester carboxylesterase